MGQADQRGVSDQFLHRLINCHVMTSLFAAGFDSLAQISQQIADMLYPD